VKRCFGIQWNCETAQNTFHNVCRVWNVRPIQTCELEPNSSHTISLSEFDPCGFAYQAVSTDKRYSKSPVIDRGDNVVKTFLSRVLEEENVIMDNYIAWNRTYESYLWDGSLVWWSYTLSYREKVWNHDHITEEIFDIAHRNCNLQLYTSCAE
jgi:hypothetical protein